MAEIVMIITKVIADLAGLLDLSLRCLAMLSGLLIVGTAVNILVTVVVTIKLTINVSITISITIITVVTI